MLTYQEVLPFFNDDGSLDELSSTQIKPANEAEYDEITSWLDAHDIEYEGVYDPRKHEDADPEDWEIWNSLFDPNSDECIEVLM